MTIIIEVDADTDVPRELVEELLKKHLDGHRFFERLSFPIMAATAQPLYVKGVRVSALEGSRP